MGRPRKAKNRYLPPRMHLRHGAYYLVEGSGSSRKWIRLGSTYGEAFIEYARRVPQRQSGRMFSDLVVACQRHPEWAKLAPRTRSDYTRALKYLLKAFGDAPVNQISASDVDRYMAARSSKDDANREKAVLSKMLGLAVRWEWCNENAALKVPYHPREKRRRIISQAEWKAIKLAARGDMIPVFMDLAYVTGLRVSDVLALQWKQVTDEGLYVLQGKNRVEGLYTLTDDLRAILDRAKRLHMESGKVSRLLTPDTHILHTRKRQPYTYNGLRSMWVRTVARAEVEGVRIHDIRRTAITHAKKAGRNPRDFSLHKTEAQAQDYVVEVPQVEPLAALK